MPSFAKDIVLIPAFKRKSVFDISRSIKSFQSFLYDASIFSPLCLSVNTSYACNISAQKIKSNAKSAFLNIFCNENSRLCLARQGVALAKTELPKCFSAHCAVRVSGRRYNIELDCDFSNVVITILFELICDSTKWLRIDTVC